MMDGETIAWGGGRIDLRRRGWTMNSSKPLSDPASDAAGAVAVLPAPSGSGMGTSTAAPTSKTPATEPSAAGSTTPSPGCFLNTELTSAPPSGLVAVPPSTPTVTPLPDGWASADCSDRNKAVASAFLGVLSEILSPDQLTLGMLQGELIAKAAGVPDETWAEIVKEVIALAAGRRKTHPLAGLF